MTKKIVVARFNENLDWLNEIKPAGDVLILNKGGVIKSEFEIINLDNKGFEANSYLYYIINNYDNLPDTTYFLQGNPFDHCEKKDLFNAINSKSISFYPIAKEHNIVNSDGSPNHIGLGDDLKKIWNELFGYDQPEKWHFFFGAQFAVNKNLIKRRNIDFYKKAFNLIESKLEACAIERAWHYIFCS